MTTPTISRVEIGGQALTLSERVSLTQPLPASEIAETIGQVVALSDPEFVLDVVTSMQLHARVEADTGERLSFEEVAQRHGFDLAKLRAE